MYLSITVFAFTYIAMWGNPLCTDGLTVYKLSRGKTQRFYVLDPQLCETITPKYWQSYDDK